MRTLLSVILERATVGDTAVRSSYLYFLIWYARTIRYVFASRTSFFPPVHYIRLEVSTTFIPTIQHLFTVLVAHQLAR